MLLVAVAGIPLGWVGWKVDRARNQRMVVAELQELHPEIIYDYQIALTNNGSRVYRDVPPPGPKWLIDLLGKECFVEVVQIEVDDPQVTDRAIALIAKLPSIDHLLLTSAPEITDDGLVHFAGMHNLEMVALYSDHLTGVGLAHLRGLRRLKYLSAEGWIDDASLEHVSKLERLESLYINGVAEITDRGLAQIAKLTNLRFLGLGFGAPHTVDIQDHMTITDEGLASLYGLKNLESLDLRTTGVTEAGIDKLQKALPNCKIKWRPKDRTYPR